MPLRTNILVGDHTDPTKIPDPDRPDPIQPPRCRTGESLKLNTIPYVKKYNLLCSKCTYYSTFYSNNTKFLFKNT